jgi:spectinomycin phosphotransferase
MSERQWQDLGAALKAVHTVQVPAALKRGIPLETYSAHWRDSVKGWLERAEREPFPDRVAAELASLLRARREEILGLVRRAGELAPGLRARSLDPVVCHSDLHAGNVLLTADQELYIVDWDNPILACKERDLMSVGGALFGGWYTAEQEERLFYQGYGPAEIDFAAVAYYRYERIIMDIAAFCELIFLTGEGEDREQSLRYVQLNFQPGGTIERARKAENLVRSSDGMTRMTAPQGHSLASRLQCVSDSTNGKRGQR